MTRRTGAQAVPLGAELPCHLEMPHRTVVLPQARQRPGLSEKLEARKGTYSLERGSAATAGPVRCSPVVRTGHLPLVPAAPETVPPMVLAHGNVTADFASATRRRVTSASLCLSGTRLWLFTEKDVLPERSPGDFFCKTLCSLQSNRNQIWLFFIGESSLVAKIGLWNVESFSLLGRGVLQSGS